MTERREEIEPFITGIFDAYMEAMALEGCWGGMSIALCLFVSCVPNCTTEAAGDCQSHAGMSRELCSFAGEPELAIAFHCLQRPIVVYRQVRCSLPSAVSSESQDIYLDRRQYHMVINDSQTPASAGRSAWLLPAGAEDPSGREDTGEGVGVWRRRVPRQNPCLRAVLRSAL